MIANGIAIIGLVPTLIATEIRQGLEGTVKTPNRQDVSQARATSIAVVKPGLAALRR